jgi:hypothetical protein
MNGTTKKYGKLKKLLRFASIYLIYQLLALLRIDIFLLKVHLLCIAAISLFCQSIGFASLLYILIL